MFGDGNDLNSQEAFESYFYSIAGDMLFDEDLELTIDYSNYVVFKQFEVTAVQKVGAPVDFSALGIGNEYTISARPGWRWWIMTGLSGTRTMPSIF